MGLPPRALKPEPTEKQFLQMVRDLARLNGWLCFHTHDSRRSEPGFPDLVLCGRGRLIMAELKVGKNAPTDEQTRWLEAFIAAGIPAFVWTPADWRDIETALTTGPLDRPGATACQRLLLALLNRCGVQCEVIAANALRKERQ